jgi:hypothetical protein
MSDQPRQPASRNAVAIADECRLISMEEVSGILGVPVYTGREWARRGILPTVKVGRRVFCRAVRLREWILEHESGGGHHGDGHGGA